MGHNLSEHLAYSPAVMFVSVVFGVFFHELYKIDLVKTEWYAIAVYIGFFFLLMSPLLIMWAQSTRRNVIDHPSSVTRETLHAGPYSFSRNPSYLGQLFLIGGLALLLNSLIILGVVFILFVYFTLYYIPREEYMMKEDFGEEFGAYKKRTRMWI